MDNNSSRTLEGTKAAVVVNEEEEVDLEVVVEEEDIEEAVDNIKEEHLDISKTAVASEVEEVIVVVEVADSKPKQSAEISKREPASTATIADSYILTHNRRT